MREEGLEPSTLAGPDPKSGAYANSATLATGGRHFVVSRIALFILQNLLPAASREIASVGISETNVNCANFMKTAAATPIDFAHGAA